MLKGTCTRFQISEVDHWKFQGGGGSQKRKFLKEPKCKRKVERPAKSRTNGNNQLELNRKNVNKESIGALHEKPIVYLNQLMNPD